jgi:hypothetical protein
MPGEIVLLVDKVVVRDDGDVIGQMRADLTTFHGYTENMKTEVSHVLEQWLALMTAFDTAVQGFATHLDALLVRPPLPTVDPQAVEAVADQIRAQTDRIRAMVPDTPAEG